MSFTINEKKLADLVEWLGTDGITFLNIRMMFATAENADSNLAKDMNECLDKFHGYCEKIVVKTRG